MLINLVFKKSGVYEWIIVRLSAIFIACYIIYLFNSILFFQNLSYDEWYNFFNNKVNKIFNFIILLFILIHTWIGMRHILEDYIKLSILKKFIIGFTAAVLHIYLLLGIIIIWGI